MRRAFRPLAALALISVISAGCGSNAPSETPTATSADTGATKKATDQDKAVKLAECIRGHGVPHFPDPDAKGDFAFGIDVSPAVWKKAVDACKDLAPPGAFSGRRSPKQQSAALRFANCIRAHGVKDFPDPVNGDPLVDTTKIPSSNRPGGMTILNAAMHKCGSILGRAAGGQG
jgi:predicted small lipoprotein YifL